MDYNVPLFEHQKEVLPKMKNGCVLWGGVGSGKSRVAMAYYMEHEAPKNIIVITTAKKRDSKDWEGEAAQFAVGKEAQATVAGILTVDSWNNLHKYEGLQDHFFVFDEQRLVGSGAWVRSFLKIARENRWIMLSATPGDTWLDYIPVFVANGFFRNRTEFKREHVVFKPYTKNYAVVERYVGVQKLCRLRSEILVHMRYYKQNLRHELITRVSYDVKTMRRVMKDRWNVFEDKPIEQVADLFYLMRRVAYSDPTRLAKVRELAQTHKKLVVFYNFNYELEALRGLAEEFKVAEWNGYKHEELPPGDEWIYLVQYIAGAEGWNCTETNHMVFYSLTYSYKLWEQAHGRIDRVNSEFKHLYYYVFLSSSKIDRAVWAALGAKKNFNEASFRA